jgi:hypothetical protein
MFFRDDGYGQDENTIESRLKKLEKKLKKKDDDDTFSLTSTYVHDEDE